MLWTILIATLSSRRDHLAQLLAGLLPQVNAAGGMVAVDLLWNHGERPIATLRQELLAGSVSEYVCFVDDDDLVAPDYVGKILTGLQQGPDCVGFLLSVGYRGGALITLSLSHEGWYNDDSGMYRDITHLSPLRRELACHGDFTADPGIAHHGEDRGWAAQVRPYLAGAREVFIDQVLYCYCEKGRGTRPREAGELAAIQRDAARPELASPYARWHPASSFSPPWRR